MIVRLLPLGLVLPVGVASCAGDENASDSSSSTTSSSSSGGTTEVADASTSGASSTSTTGPADSGTTVPVPECGNGTVEAPEECDDGNMEAGDGCDPDCTATVDTSLWTATHAGDAAVQEAGQGIAVDSADNVIVAGYVVDVAGNADIWVRKYDPDGNEVWTQVLDPSSGMDDRAYGVAIDSMDNIVVVGDAAAGPSVSDLWIAKLDPQGAELWSTTIDGPGSGADLAEDVAVDSNDNVVVTGWVRVANSDNDIWVGKLSSAGATLWTDIVAGPDTLDDRGQGIGVAPGDDVVVTGYVSDSNPGRDVWLRRYDPDGAEVWTTVHDSVNSGIDMAFDLTVAPDGTIAVSGSTPIVANNDDVWLARFDENGEFVFQKKFGGPAVIDDHGLGVAADADNAFIVVGFKGVSSTNSEIWLRKWDEIGDVVWSQTVAGRGMDRDRALDAAVDSQNNIVVTGEIRPMSNNDGNIWVAKFGP